MFQYNLKSIITSAKRQLNQIDDILPKNFIITPNLPLEVKVYG